MNRLTVWNKHFTRNEARFKEVIGDEVPFGPVEIDNEVGFWVPKPQAFLEVLCQFHERIDLIDALREASKAVEGLILSVHIINHVVD